MVVQMYSEETLLKNKFVKVSNKSINMKIHRESNFLWLDANKKGGMLWPVPQLLLL